MDVIGIIIGLLAGIVIGYLIAHSKNAAAETRANMLEQQIAKLESDLSRQKEELQANYQPVSYTHLTLPTICSV